MLNHDEWPSVYKKISESYARRRHDFGKTEFERWKIDLEDFEAEQIINAFSAHERTSTFLPQLSDMLRFLPSKLNHPTPEVALAMTPKSETSGAYVTDQMVQAWRVAELQPDSVQRRMAFLEAYKEIMASCEANKVEAKFFYSRPSSLHGDAARQLEIDSAITAHNHGLISMKQAVTVMLKCNQTSDPSYYQENTEEAARVLCGAKRSIVKYIINEVYQDETILLESLGAGRQLPDPQRRIEVKPENKSIKATKEAIKQSLSMLNNQDLGTNEAIQF